MRNRYNHLPSYKYTDVEGVTPVLEKSAGKPIRDYKIYGNSVQTETPNPIHPQNIENVGIFDDTLGKFKIPVTIRGKNYFDDKLLSQTEDYNAYDERTGLWTTNEATNYSRSIFYNASSATGDRDITKLVKVPKNTTISIKFYDFTNPNPDSEDSNGEKRLGYAFFDGNGKIIGSQTLSSKDMITLNTPNEECWLDIRRYYSSGVMSFSKIQIEEGMESTTYQPYAEPATYEMLLDEPLRKIGDYSDYIDFKNQKIIRNIKEIDVSTLSWIYSSAYELHVSPIADGIIYNTIKTSCSLCSHFPLFVGNPSYMDDNKFQHPSVYSTTKSYLVVKNTNYNNAKDFKDYLTSLTNDGNPVLLCYILVNPIEESIELPAVETYKHINIFEVNTNPQPSNMKIQYYKKGGK